jgi:primosomal protein N' (replication factor Y)
MQVAGRSGRAEKSGVVAIQTRNPENPLLQVLLREGYLSFANHLMQERELAHFPPYTFMALLRADSKDIAITEDFLNFAKTHVANTNGQTTCLGPIAAPLARKANRHRSQLLLQSQSRYYLHHALTSLTNALYQQPRRKDLRWSLDIDPQELY